MIEHLFSVIPTTLFKSRILVEGLLVDREKEVRNFERKDLKTSISA